MDRCPVLSTLPDLKSHLTHRPPTVSLLPCSILLLRVASREYIVWSTCKLGGWYEFDEVAGSKLESRPSLQPQQLASITHAAISQAQAHSPNYRINNHIHTPQTGQINTTYVHRNKSTAAESSSRLASARTKDGGQDSDHTNKTHSTSPTHLPTHHASDPPTAQA